jgi:enoyl-CoA hydratase
MTTTSPVSLTIDTHIATLTMDDGRANAINFEFLHRFEEALLQAEAAKVLIIRGRENVLCGGLDLPALQPLKLHKLEEFFELFDRIHERLLSYPRPIVTYARGAAIAGGAILLCAGDVRLVTPKGKIGINESMLGFSFPTPAIELVRCAIGDQNLSEAAISGRLYEGADRLRIGFATEVVAPELIEERARALALELAGPVSDAVAYIRLQVRRAAILRVKEHAVADRGRFLVQWETSETQERVRAIVARLTKH